MRDYRIFIDHDNLEPEELLLEAVSPDSRIERPLKSEFFIAFYFSILVVLAIFAATGFKLSILDNDYFTALAVKNQFINIPISPPRGLTYSREGTILAENRETYGLWLLPFRLTINEKEEIIVRLSEILNLSIENLTGLIEKNSGKASFLIESDISEEKKEKISSLGSLALVIAKNNTRVYPDGKSFSHLLGYVNLVNENDLSKDSFYQTNDQIGRFGLESYYESYLRGKRGEILINRFSDGMQELEPHKGNSLVLNINSKLQKDIYSELENGLRQIGREVAVAVAQDPRDGRILSLISLPSFNNNSFVRGLTSEEFKVFFENKKDPLLNRVISGRFSPGSTIKPLIALAALEEGVINPSQKINAPGFITITNPYNPEIVYTFRDWKNHGLVNMREAIANSSDIYFYTVGGGFYDIKGLGIERIARYLKMFKVDSILGIDLGGEAAGFVPDPEWKRQNRGEIWYQGDTFNVSIGQGDLLITPLWLTSYIAAIGNNGFLYKPFIVDKILNEEGNIIKTFGPEVLASFNFNEENLNVVKEGMKLVAEVGTAKVLGDLPFKVGAKSGTAEVVKGQSTSSWITVFAPYDNPQIALTIMMESGKEGSYIPHQIAYRVLENYFK
ncbi:MAG: penicillin-binding protein 2 [Parcubacteria group bacterium RIFCSPLOWO2_12_FULL_40_10]|nr:MAG: penicillin-binding protein 2 [Parcubacteria group bacterium RIFCSPLOWO2_12_FULL_40_10]